MELRARDILKELPVRKPVGERLLDRVLRRSNTLPVFIRRGRIFSKLGLPNPWDLEDTKVVSIELGEVGLPQHREPKPHLMPKEAPKPGPKFPSIPGMPPPQPKSEGGKPAPQIGAMRKDDTAELKAKLAEKERKAAEALREARNTARPQSIVAPAPNSPAVAKLPIRPDLAAGLKTPNSAPKAVPPPMSQASSQAGPQAGPKAMPKPAARPIRSAVVSPVLEELPLESLEPKPEPRPSAADIADLFGTGGGGWEVRRFEELPAAPALKTEPQTAPEAPRSQEPPPEPLRSQEIQPPPDPPRSQEIQRPPESRPISSEIGRPPARKPPISGGGLDDLFGMGGGETRVRIPKPSERSAEGENKPRRPMVTSQEDLAKQTIDRRPPPAKPPVVVPKPGAAPTPDPEPDE